MDFAAARRKMVDNQVRPNGVTDLRVIEAMLAVPREHFVPPAKAALAYMDGDLPVASLGPGGAHRCALKPMVTARMLQALDLAPTDQVLEVACGTGYTTALLARTTAKVLGLEENESVAAAAAKLLTEAGVTNASVVCGPLADGWPAQAPYDVIVVEGAVEEMPQALLSQLREGGRLIAVVGTGPVGRATLWRRVGQDVAGVPVFDAVATPLPAFSKPPAFVF